MNRHMILIGVGEMGGVFARGFLRSGYTVTPVTRDSNITEVAAEHPQSELVLVAVAETDLHPVLEQTPACWQDRLVLLQNELLPRDWQRHGLDNPTVISVWFEKKKGMDAKVIIPSPVYGPHAQAVHDALASIDIPANMLDSAEALTYQLVLKNLYIVTTNITGLYAGGGTVSEVWEEKQETMSAIAWDVLDIQEWLTGQTFDRDQLIKDMLICFDGDPDHQCMGRSAPARLQRALQQAEQAGLHAGALKGVDAAIKARGA